MISVLITSVFSMCSGIISWVDRRIFLPLVIANEALVPPSDGVRELVKILLVYGSYTVILRRFGKSLISADNTRVFYFPGGKNYTVLRLREGIYGGFQNREFGVHNQY